MSIHDGGSQQQTAALERIQAVLGTPVQRKYAPRSHLEATFAGEAGPPDKQTVRARLEAAGAVITMDALGPSSAMSNTLDTVVLSGHIDQAPILVRWTASDQQASRVEVKIFAETAAGQLHPGLFSVIDMLVGSVKGDQGVLLAYLSERMEKMSRKDRRGFASDLLATLSEVVRED